MNRSNFLVLTIVAFVVALFVAWYVESFKDVFIERGIAERGKISFKSIRLDSGHGLVIKYNISDLPNVENTGYLIPWRSGHRSLSDEYLESRRNQKPPAAAQYDSAKSINASQLTGEFALEQAPKFDEMRDTKLVTTEKVIAELRQGYGGTLVVSPRDDTLDSAGFLAHYLRAFSIPDSTDANGLSTYDYRFERILARISGNTTTMKDKRLDWDVFRAFLLYEDFATETGNFNDYTKIERGEKYVRGLDSAKDLLWGYLRHNSQAILKDKDRLEWWIDALTKDLKSEPGRPLRRWFLLQLVASTDTQTAALYKLKNDPQKIDPHFPRRRAHPFDLFLESDDASIFDEDLGERPPFREAVAKIAESQGLKFEAWGLDPNKMPPTKAYRVDLAPRLSQWSPSVILGQESWSKKPAFFRVTFFSPVGRRFTRFNVQLPSNDNADGVFFFTYNARLYVWPKARMDDAVIQMLSTSGLISDARLKQFHEKGFQVLETSVSSGNPTKVPSKKID